MPSVWRHSQTLVTGRAPGSIPPPAIHRSLTPIGVPGRFELSPNFSIVLPTIVWQWQHAAQLDEAFYRSRAPDVGSYSRRVQVAASDQRQSIVTRADRIAPVTPASWKSPCIVQQCAVDLSQFASRRGGVATDVTRVAQRVVTACFQAG